VFHLAANSIVQHGVKDPVNNYEVNVMGTVKVLDSVRRINPHAKVVVASSDKAYGDHEVMPYVEDMKLNPGCPYSTSKSCTDMVSQSFAMTYGLDVNTVRCSNIYGPGDMNLSRLIPNSILRCLRGDNPEIYSGVAKYRREFIYIDDVCEAYNLVANLGTSGEIYNIGINSFHTIEEVVSNISDLAGLGIVDIVDKSFPEIKFQWMDGSKLASLGWKAEVPFEEGLRRCVDWYTKRAAEDRATQTWAQGEK
jgi:CDP-glucose 4,6-dehydratase